MTWKIELKALPKMKDRGSWLWKIEIEGHEGCSEKRSSLRIIGLERQNEEKEIMAENFLVLMRSSNYQSEIMLK